MAEHIDAVGDSATPVIFPVVPDGHAQHVGYSFGMATAHARSEIGQVTHG